jgi:DNA polymerase V
MLKKPGFESNVLKIFRIDNGSESVKLPLYQSSIKAGFPSPADDYIEGNLDITKFLIQNPAASFIVQVSGMSMQGAGILHEDYLVVNRAWEPLHEDIVVASVDSEFTVKRFLRDEDGIILAPENEAFQPIEITGEMQLEIWGVVGSSFRRYRTF